jgi:hypothetical protein
MTARGIAVLALVACLPSASSSAADTVKVGSRPAPVRENPTSRSPVVLTVPPSTELQAFDREGTWVWVVAREGTGGPTRAGWIDQQFLARPEAPARPEATRPSTPAAASVSRSADSSESAPPPSPARLPAAAPAAGGPSAAGTTTEFAAPGNRDASLASLAEAARLASSAASKAAGSSSGGRDPRAKPPAVATGEPPSPVGGPPKEHGSALGEWIQPQALRASLAFNYQATSTRQDLGALDDRLYSGGGTIATSFAVLDPRILSVDFAGDFQAGRTTSRAPLASFRDTSALRSYRLSLGVLTGLNAPLRLFADRLSSSSNLQPLSETIDPFRRTRGVRSGAGFTWDITDAHLPRIQISASTGRQADERNYVFGYSSTNDERRVEVRAGREHAFGRYQVEYSHASYLYDVPGAGVRSATGNDILQGSLHLTPSSRLSLDLSGRNTRFGFDVGERTTRVSGTGGDAGGRFDLGGHVSISGRYSFSSNAFEAALSGRIDPQQAGAAPVTSADQLGSRTLFHDGEARVEYATRPVTLAAVLKSVSFGVPSFQAPTLTDLTTMGGVFRVEHTWGGFAVHAGGDAATGRARSNQGLAQHYDESGVTAGVSHDASTGLRFGVDAGIRRVGRLSFFPVSLESRSTSLRLETMRPGWARLRATVTRFDNLRDIMLSDSRDQHTGYSLGIAGSRYDLSADIDRTDTNSLLLSPSVLGSRPDVAILVASRPDLFRNLLAARDRTRLVSLQVRPFAGFQLQGRLRRQEQAYPNLFGFEVRGAQAWASYQVREVQLEFGWEYFDSRTSFGNVRDRRIYFRVRRDVLFF